MKQFFMLIIVGLAIALALSFAITFDPGYVQISIGNWLIESNLWVMIAVNFFVFSAIIYTLSLVRRLLKTKNVVRNWVGNSGTTRAKQKTEKGLIALLEGDWSNANKLLSRAAEKSESPVINYVGAARAANELGNVKVAEQLIKAAYDSSPSSELAVGLAQAQIQLEQNQLEQCLATLLRLRKKHTNHPFVLKLLKAVYLRLEDWQQLLTIIPALRKAPNANREKLNKLERIAWNTIFIQKIDKLDRSSDHNEGNENRHKNTEQLASLWKQIPGSLRFEDQLIETYALQLSKLGNAAESESLLRKTIGKHWSDALVRLYGLIPGKNVSEQLITAENWLKERPNNAALLLTLGRLSLRNELWGKALEYFEASNRFHPSQESYAELYRLNNKMNDGKHKNQQLLAGFIHTLELPDLPLPSSSPKI